MFDLKGIKDSADVTLKNKVDGKVVLFANYCAETSFDFKSGVDYAKKKGVKAIRWDKEKEGTFKLSTEVFELKWLPILLGGEFKSGDITLTRREEKTVATGKTVALKEAPRTGTMQVFVLNSKDKVSHDKELIATAEADITGNKYKYDTMTKELTVDSLLNGQCLAIYYIPEKLPKGQSFKVNAYEFPINYEIEGYTAVRNVEGKDDALYFHILNCKPKSEVTLNFSVDNVAKLEMEFDLFGDAENNFVEYAVLDEE